MKVVMIYAMIYPQTFELELNVAMANTHNDALNTNHVPAGVPGGFFIYDVFGDEGICYADQNVLDLFGCTDIEDLRSFTGDSFIGMVHPDDRQRVSETIKEYNGDRRKGHNYIRYRIVTKQGTYRFVEDFGHLIKSNNGITYCYVFIAGLEQVEYDDAERYSFSNAGHESINLNVDSLTGLQNMDALYLMAKEMQYDDQTEPESSYAFVVFDILGLRKINRSLGHAEGDARIVDLAERVGDSIPQPRRIFRGHDADIIAVCENSSEQDLKECISTVTKTCKSPILFGVSSTANVDSSLCITRGNALLLALEEAQLDLRLKKMLNQKSNQSQSLTSLVRALEEVDANTEAHVRRTQKMGIALGRRIGLPDLQLSKLQLLCLLHDIGKIAVPLEILNKPGKLTDDEWAALRAHSEKGYQIAIATDELKPLAEPILYHHERWDGKGYPKGLKGEAIPVLSRIISIVDAYDAMVNDRCYRKAMPPEAAKQEIRDNAGKQFDPVLADAFLALLKESPKLSYGVVTDSGEVKVFENKVSQSGGVGKTKQVVFSKYALDLDDKIIDVDELFETLTGYTREDAVGKMTQYDLIPEAEKDYYIEQVQLQFSKGNNALLMHPLQRKDGSVIQVMCNGERYFDSSVRAFRSSIMIIEVN